jgi:hypothetical protein
MAVKLHPGAQASGRLLGRVDFDEGHFLYPPARQPDLQQLNNIRKQTRYQLRNVLLVYQFLLAIISIQVRFLVASKSPSTVKLALCLQLLLVLLAVAT